MSQKSSRWSGAIQVGGWSSLLSSAHSYHFGRKDDTVVVDDSDDDDDKWRHPGTPSGRWVGDVLT